MKLRKSGMPEKAYWETLLNVPLILDRLSIGARLRDVVNIRPQPEQIVTWAVQAGGLAPVGGVVDLLPWHYGLRFQRT